MKKLALLCAAAIAGTAAAAMLAGPVLAQSDGRYDYENGWGDPYGDGFARGSNFPGGSWRASCRMPNWRGPVLTAQCRTSYDNWVFTRINPSNCPSRRLINSNGRLICEDGSGGWGQGSGWQLPVGSWRQTCRYPVMRGRFLSAQCQTSGGGWINSSVDTGQCRSGSISNQNGRLFCDGGYGGGPGWGDGQYPGGSWNQSCRNSSMRGSVLYAQCSDRSGYYSGSSLDMRQCNSNRASNRDGQLVCDY